MLVYWELMVWSIIANGLVCVKYKNAYKIKTNGFKLLCVSDKPMCVGHETHPGCVNEAADGG